MTQTINQLLAENIDRFCEIKLPANTAKYECPRCHKKHNKEKFSTYNEFRNPQTERYCSDKCKKG